MSRGRRFPGILLSGPVGSGKTTLLLAIGEILERSGAPYALLDLDWLAWIRPASGSALTVSDVLCENLRTIWGTFRRAGVERLALARSLGRAEHLEAVRRALPDVDLLVVRLAVPEQALEQRLRHRDSGDELAEHLALIARVPEPGLEDAVVDNGDDRYPGDVALEIVRLAGWPTDVEPPEHSPSASA